MAGHSVGVVLVCLAASGCGAAAGSVRAQQRVYDVSYGQVWAAALTEVRTRYGHLAVEAPTTGLIVSEWAWYTADGTRRPDDSNDGDALFRVTIHVIERGDGWTFRVDGDSELIDREQARAHIPTEPPRWVRAELDEVYLAIHARLGGDAM